MGDLMREEESGDRHPLYTVALSHHELQEKRLNTSDVGLLITMSA